MTNDKRQQAIKLDREVRKLVRQIDTTWLTVGRLCARCRSEELYPRLESLWVDSSRIASHLSSEIARNAATTFGSNCVPDSRMISSRATASGRPPPIGAVGHDGLHRIRDRENPRPQWNLLANQPLGVARAVRVFLTRQHDLGSRSQKTHLANGIVSNPHVRLHANRADIKTRLIPSNHCD